MKWEGKSPDHKEKNYNMEREIQLPITKKVILNKMGLLWGKSWKYQEKNFSDVRKRELIPETGMYQGSSTAAWAILSMLQVA